MFSKRCRRLAPKGLRRHGQHEHDSSLEFRHGHHAETGSVRGAHGRGHRIFRRCVSRHGGVAAQVRRASGHRHAHRRGRHRRHRYRSAGEFFAPVTIRTPCGGGIRGGQTHSQSPEGIFTHVSGIKVVMPSNPYDAKGLLITSIEDDDPVVFFEPKRLYNGPFDGDPTKPAVPWSSHPKGQVDEGYYKVPLGKADIVRAGAAAAMNVSAEIIDLRSLVPLDVDTLCSSVRKTGRCIVAHEATRFSGFGAELLSIVQEECFWDLEAPIQRVTGWDTPYPHAFEWEYFPGQARVAMALKTVMESA